jgi:hypothetical protein
MKRSEVRTLVWEEGEKKKAQGGVQKTTKRLKGCPRVNPDPVTVFGTQREVILDVWAVALARQHCSAVCGKESSTHQKRLKGECKKKKAQGGVQSGECKQNSSPQLTS